MIQPELEVSLLTDKAREGSLLLAVSDQATMSAGSPARPEGNNQCQ